MIPDKSKPENEKPKCEWTVSNHKPLPKATHIEYVL